MNSTPLACRLEGKRLGKWTVVKRRDKKAENSGFFSAGYLAKDEEGSEGFLKAFNYQYAFKSSGAHSADVLKMMTENFTYERDLLKLCFDHRMRRVVIAIDSGEFSEPGEVFPVPFLVFEVADGGDLKEHKEMAHAGLAWRLHAFHGALLGLTQLHRAKIAHQDIKPSNVLIFGKNISKLADLGSATQLGNSSNFENGQFAGDFRYAPIELFYRYFSTDWETRRFGGDFFMMGGLLTYLVADVNFLAIMMSKLTDEQKPKNFGGTFQQALPFLMNSYHLALADLKAVIPESVRDELLGVIAELSHPDPEKRGNPSRLLNQHSRFSLERYVSVIDRLAGKIR